ncbi:WD repeat-containing protein 5B, putative [Entamoeba invadens IP1]|uniref:WD repeat-containing protein 5B, putative n=1 Tax=Entamoeba invadens IP1 TaxID=370355 RepID=A0A0A1U7Q0_ENTIV|nr:WD repeat-containing protein 5B, putative [Entamoeba invadens IP1]ELP90872.1 WD repeat-containing protein 5B, putative [Entamoeba invadens IP1]|eukprot:XP_004257643.1 WD repeat-containing protein 5B, putative [Entamoeba invadens IP1]
MEPKYTKYVLGRVNSQSYQSSFKSVIPELSCSTENWRFFYLNMFVYNLKNSFAERKSFITIFTLKLCSLKALDGYVMEWDTESFNFTNDFYIGHEGTVNGITDEQNCIAVVCNDGSTSLVDRRFGKIVTLETAKRKSRHCCFCQNKLAIGYDDGIIKFWDIVSQKWGDSIEQHREAITSMSSRKNEIMSSSLEGSVAVWNVEKNEERYHFKLDKPINSCKYVPNGKMILLSTSNGDAFFYKLENNSKSSYFHGFSKNVDCVPFDFLTDTREGQFLKKFIVSSDENRNINFWSVETMKCVATIDTLDSPVTALSCHPTQMILITGGNISDTSIKLWK